jgi:siroheme synthase-like protein
MFYPVYLDLRNRPALVVGGGAVAERKVESLMEAGARVTLVSPQATEALCQHSEAGRIVLHRRRFELSDLDGVCLVISATDDTAVQAKVAAAAEARNIPVNTVDIPELCTFIVPAVVRRGSVTVAISTGGKSPSLAAALRSRMESVLTDEVARTADLLGSIRDEVHERFKSFEQRKRVFEQIIDSGIMEWIGECDDAAALERVRRMIDKMP